MLTISGLKKIAAKRPILRNKLNECRCHCRMHRHGRHHRRRRCRRGRRWMFSVDSISETSLQVWGAVWDGFRMNFR